MAVLVYFIAQQYAWQSWSLIEQVILLCALLAVAMVSYFGALFVFGVRLKTIKEASV
jgi:putative peptidoglycan lipid II flippase